MNGDVLGPPFPVVHNQLLCLADIEGDVVVLAPHSQFSNLLHIGCLIVASRPTNVVSSANLMMAIESGAATQSLGEQWVQGVWDDGVDVSHDQPIKAFHDYRCECMG